jgi:hypothetical protein
MAAKSENEMQVPKKLKRTLKKLAGQGEEATLIAPAIIHSRASQNMLAMARIGMTEKIFSYIVATNENLHFIWPGLAWDRVRSLSLEQITDIEYVDEFTTKTIKLHVGTASEKVIFYEEMDGIRLYRYVKFKQWKR